MKHKANIKLHLTDAEKQLLRRNKLKISDIAYCTVEELTNLLSLSFDRAREIHALAEFQTIPSIGVNFAQGLISLGYYSLHELKGKDGAKLVEAFELQKGYWIDPCVEDQFRLVVHYANTGDLSKNWWDFTETRKTYRLKNGYPANRPTLAGHETLKHKKS